MYVATYDFKKAYKFFNLFMWFMLPSNLFDRKLIKSKNYINYF